MDYIAHYGIKGMKWGVRRYQNYDGTLKNKKGRKRGLSDKQKRYIKRGAIAVGIVLSLYGVHKLSTNSNAKILSKGKDFVSTTAIKNQKILIEKRKRQQNLKTSLPNQVRRNMEVNGLDPYEFDKFKLDRK